MAACDNVHQLYGEHPYQVMVVDEQDVFRRKIRDILHGIGGFQVVAEVVSCSMALETVACVQIDLVIVELALGDGDGVALIARLKQLAKPPHVIVFSTSMHESSLMQVILAGADGYLLKDTPTRDIIRAFKNFERGGPAMQPAVTAHVLHLLVVQCKTPGVPLLKDKHAHKPTLVAPDSSYEDGFIPISDNKAMYTNNESFPVHLSPQEEKVFALLRQGQRNKQIAAYLAISPYTVSKHVQNILRKLGVVNRTQAAAYPSFEG